MRERERQKDTFAFLSTCRRWNDNSILSDKPGLSHIIKAHKSAKATLNLYLKSKPLNFHPHGRTVAPLVPRIKQKGMGHPRAMP